MIIVFCMTFVFVHFSPLLQPKRIFAICCYIMLSYVCKLKIHRHRIKLYSLLESFKAVKALSQLTQNNT